MKKIKVGITGTGSLIGQAIIKSLRFSELAGEIHMIGFDYFEDTMGSFWVEKNFLLPDFLKKEITEEDWLNRLMEIISSEAIDVIFIGIDFELELFARHKDVIESNTQCKVMVSSHDVVTIADDKYLTYNFLKSRGLSYPGTLLPEELAEKEIEFPCFVKPRKGSRSRDVFVVEDSQQLKEILPRIHNPIIQELIGNPNEEYTSGVICFDNKVKEMIVLRRDLKDGNTITAYFNKDVPKIIHDYVYQAAENLKPFGACNFQLRLGKDGLPKIFEINARHSGTTYMRAMFGFNEVEYILSYLLGRKFKKITLKEGRVKRYFDEVFISAE